MVYRRPAGVMRQSVKPQLASWERAGHPSQVKLARFLAHVDAIAGPVLQEPVNVRLVLTGPGGGTWDIAVGEGPPDPVSIRIIADAAGWRLRAAGLLPS
jgi:hypothetical protein